jgi:hypothetical protein
MVLTGIQNEPVCDRLQETGAPEGLKREEVSTVICMVERHNLGSMFWLAIHYVVSSLQQICVGALGCALHIVFWQTR